MSYEVKGTIETIHELTEFQGKNGDAFTKQIFTVVNNDGYEGKEQLFAIELFGDKTQLLNGMSEGDAVTVQCNVNCRHWKEDRYFTSLQAWKIEKDEAAPALPQSDVLPDFDDSDPF